MPVSCLAGSPFLRLLLPVSCLFLRLFLPLRRCVLSCLFLPLRRCVPWPPSGKPFPLAASCKAFPSGCFSLSCRCACSRKVLGLRLLLRLIPPFPAFWPVSFVLSCRCASSHLVHALWRCSYSPLILPYSPLILPLFSRFSLFIIPLFSPSLPLFSLYYPPILPVFSSILQRPRKAVARAPGLVALAI